MKGTDCPTCGTPGRLATNHTLDLYRCTKCRREFWRKIVRCNYASCAGEDEHDGYCHYHASLLGLWHSSDPSEEALDEPPRQQEDTDKPKRSGRNRKPDGRAPGVPLGACPTCGNPGVLETDYATDKNGIAVYGCSRCQKEYWVEHSPCDAPGCSNWAIDGTAYCAQHTPDNNETSNGADDETNDKDREDDDAERDDR